MTGLVYKEWKQNRWFILSMILCGALPLVFLFEKDIIGDINTVMVLASQASFFQMKTAIL